MGTCWLVDNHCAYYHKDNIFVFHNVVTFLPFLLLVVNCKEGMVLGKVHERVAKDLLVL